MPAALADSANFEAAGFRLLMPGKSMLHNMPEHPHSIFQQYVIMETLLSADVIFSICAYRVYVQGLGRGGLPWLEPEPGPQTASGNAFQPVVLPQDYPSIGYVDLKVLPDPEPVGMRVSSFRKLVSIPSIEPSAT